MDKKIPAVQSVQGVADQEARKALQSLVDGWQLRNGHTKDTGAQFVTRDDMEKFMGTGNWHDAGSGRGAAWSTQQQDAGAMVRGGGIAGAFNSLVQNIIRDIQASKLWKTLSARLDRLDAPGGVLDRIGLTETGFKTYTSQTDSKIEVINGQLVNLDGNIAAAVETAFTEVDGAFATAASVTALQVTMGETTLLAEEALTATVNLDGTLDGAWSVKFDADGYVVGAGLGIEGKDGTYTSQFLVRADRFALGSPTTPDLFPFIVDTVGGSPIIAMSGQVYIGTKTASEIAANAAYPAMNYLGSFASAPSTVGLKKNSIYKNTADKNTYVLTADGGSWSLFVPAGTDAQPTYTWVAYANDATGATGFTTGANTGQTYIGIANNKTTATESVTPGDYTWSLIKGDQGVPGTPGANGTTTYTWFAYANNSSGSSGFTTGAWAGQTYIGIATNKTTATESQTPGDYTWSLIKGDQGVPGPAGANGTNGTNGTNGSAGARGSMTFYASGSVWSDTTANNTVTTVTGSSTKIIGDTVTISNGSSFAATKYWGGSSWLSPGVVIDGNLLVSGTMSASKIGAGTVTANGIVLSSTYGSVAFGNSSSGGIVANFLAETASQYGVYVSSGKLGVSGGFTLLGGGLMNGQLKQSGSILAGMATTDSGLITDSAYVPIQGKAFNGGHGLRGRNYGSTASGAVGASNGKAFHAESGTAGPFTGSHDVAVPIGVTLEPGTIVVDTACLIRRDWSNTFCLVAVTTQANQRGVVGVYTSDLGPLSQYSILSAAYETTITDDYGNATGPLTAQYDAIKYDYNVGEINALGEGQLLVCGEGGNLEAGDLIVSSSIPGKGMKQADDLVRSYTVAKSREAVVFSSPTEVKQVACIYLCG